MFKHTLIDIAIILRTVGMIFAAVFVIRYAQQPWRKTLEGRHLMSFSTVVALFLAFATLNNITAWIDDYVPPGHVDGDYPGRRVIGVVLYLAVAFEMWRRNHLLTLALRKAAQVENNKGAIMSDDTPTDEQMRELLSKQDTREAPDPEPEEEVKQ